MRLLDTSVAVDHLRGHPPASRLLAELVTAGEQLCASELSRFELLSGVRPAELERVEAFFGVLDWVPVTEAIARHAASYAAAFRRSHPGIGVVDYLLAGTATLLGAELLTVNVRHFPMFVALRPPYAY